MDWDLYKCKGLHSAISLILHKCNTNLFSLRQARNRFIGSFILLFGILLTGNVDTAFSQNIQISGTIVNVDGEPLPGVTIMIMGTSTGTVSNLDGEYSLSAPPDGVLVFSFMAIIGLKCQLKGKQQLM
jgi:glycerol uptake facilitator-like aquaporin